MATVSTSQFSLWRATRLLAIVLEVLIVAGLIIRVGYRPPPIWFWLRVSSVCTSVTLLSFLLLLVIHLASLFSPSRRAAKFGLARWLIYFLMLAAIALFTPIE